MAMLSKPISKKSRFVLLSCLTQKLIPYSGETFTGANFRQNATRSSRRNFRGFHFRAKLLWNHTHIATSGWSV